MKHQKGSLLIEMLVSMAIGVFLMYGAFQIQLSTKRHHVYQNAVTSLEQSGRLALTLMASDIRMAGYQGCNATKKTFDIGSQINGYFSNASLNPRLGIRGWVYAGTGLQSTLNPSNWGSTASFNSVSWVTGGVPSARQATEGKDTATDFTMAQESDVMRLWTVEPYLMHTTAVSSTGVTALSTTLRGFPTGASNKFLFLSNCTKSLLTTVSSFASTSNGIRFSNPIATTLANYTGSWTGYGMLMTLVQYSLELPAGQTTPSLYRRELLTTGAFSQRIEIMPNIENMKIAYGERINGNENTISYLSANQVQDWNNVVSVRIWLLAKTPSSQHLSNETFRYFGRNYTVSDNFIRKEFTMTVSLRNRILGS